MFSIFQDVDKSKISEYKPMEYQGTLQTQEKQKIKFSSFLGKEKEYEYLPKFKVDMSLLPEYQQKEEFSKIPFDPNVRHRLPEVPNHMMYRFFYGMEPEKEAMSSYVAVNHKGTTYHLFNASRVPIGRMAVLISEVIRGKNKPTYVPTKYYDGDKCVVVNMDDPLFTGRKRQ
jgi:hypothetical protein